jgi:methylglyoxal synthase
MLTCHQLYATETTGRMLSEELGLPATRFHCCAAVLWNIPVACNRATADFLISSPLMNSYAMEHAPATQLENPSKRAEERQSTASRVPP